MARIGENQTNVDWSSKEDVEDVKSQMRRIANRFDSFRTALVSENVHGSDLKLQTITVGTRVYVGCKALSFLPIGLYSVYESKDALSTKGWRNGALLAALFPHTNIARIMTSHKSVLEMLNAQTTNIVNSDLVTKDGKIRTIDPFGYDPEILESKECALQILRNKETKEWFYVVVGSKKKSSEHWMTVHEYCTTNRTFFNSPENAWWSIWGDGMQSRPDKIKEENVVSQLMPENLMIMSVDESNLSEYLMMLSLLVPRGITRRTDAELIALTPVKYQCNAGHEMVGRFVLFSMFTEEHYYPVRMGLFNGIDRKLDKAQLDQFPDETENTIETLMTSSLAFQGKWGRLFCQAQCTSCGVSSTAEHELDISKMLRHMGRGEIQLYYFRSFCVSKYIFVNPGMQDKEWLLSP